MTKNQFIVDLNLNSTLKGAKNGHIRFQGSNYIYRIEVGTLFVLSRKNNRRNIINFQGQDVSNPQKSLTAPPQMIYFIVLSYSTAKNTSYNTLK